MIEKKDADLLEYTASVICAYVSNNSAQASDLPRMIEDIHAAFSSHTREKVVEVVAEEPLKPAVNPKKSVHDDFIICLEDGKQFKSLKRHLATHFNLSPEEYREKWNLPQDYPMVAPSYAAKRSKLALTIGLGRKAGTKTKK